LNNMVKYNVHVTEFKLKSVLDQFNDRIVEFW
jgi:hypothetical protein